MRQLDNYGREVSESTVEVFSQLIGALTWTVAHNKGRKVVAQAFDTNWNKIICEEDQTDLDTARFKHNSAVAGYVIYT
jgi:hypothetical protein